MLAEQELTGRIIGAAITVHKALGPGFLEAVYEEALALEFDHVGLFYERQKPVAIRYRGRPVGDHRLDFVVANIIYLELKAIQEIADIHYAIVRSCLKAADLQHALLLNFASMPLTVKRVGREASARQIGVESAPVPDFLPS